MVDLGLGSSIIIITSLDATSNGDPGVRDRNATTCVLPAGTDPPLTRIQQ